MIRSFRSLALKNYFERDDASPFEPQDAKRIRLMLLTLEVAISVTDLRVPPFSIYRLKDVEEWNRFAFRLRDDWRISLEFELESELIVRVDLEATNPRGKEYPREGGLALAPMHPGELLREEVIPFFAGIGISLGRLAKMLDVSPESLRDLASEESTMTSHMAEQLGLILETEPGIWMRMQSSYDDAKSKAVTPTA